MEDQETKPEDRSTPKDLATDVARLYSLAQVDDLNYRVFARRRKPSAQSSLPSNVEDNGSAAEPSNSPAQLAIESTSPASATLSPSVPETISAEPETVAAPAPIVLEEAPRSHWIEPENCPEKTGVSTSIAIVSLAGGVGKTTITANLGRLLCAVGELVLLVEASPSGLLPFYFGAADLRFGLRTFWAPKANALPMHVMGSESITNEWIENHVLPAMRMSQRAIFDVGPGALNIMPALLATCAAVVVPVLSDLNSILTVARIETIFKSMHDRGVRTPLPFYLSNKFDEQNPVEQRGRELIARQVGDRLLPFTIRRSRDVADAIAERMTVADHAPESDITHDFLKLVLWVRKTAPIPQPARTAGRWSER